MKKNPDSGYYKIIGALLFLAVMAMGTWGWLILEGRQASQAKSMLKAAQNSAKSRDPQIARICALGEESYTLLEQHTANSAFIVTLGALLFGGIGFLAWTSIKQSSTDAAKKEVSLIKEEITEKIKSDFTQVDEVLRRILEWQISGSPTYREINLDYASNMKRTEFIGLWREILLNKNNTINERKLAIKALRLLKDTTSATNAADELERASREIFRNEQPPSQIALLISAVETFAEFKQARSDIESLLRELLNHPDTELQQAVRNTMAQLQLAFSP